MADAFVFNDHKVEVVVGGENLGLIPTEGMNLLTFAKKLTKEAGYRAYSVYVDRVGATADMATSSLEGAKLIEIVLKDDKG